MLDGLENVANAGAQHCVALPLTDPPPSTDPAPVVQFLVSMMPDGTMRFHWTAIDSAFLKQQGIG